MSRRHSLYDENSNQRKELKASLDLSSDGKLSKDEVSNSKALVQALYEENSADRQGLYKENSTERRALFSENSAQRESLLKTFDFDADGKISKEEMEEANSILDSMLK
jgi:Ca2+-binding EF-hand superfamily protein